MEHNVISAIKSWRLVARSRKLADIWICVYRMSDCLGLGSGPKTEFWSLRCDAPRLVEIFGPKMRILGGTISLILMRRREEPADAAERKSVT